MKKHFYALVLLFLVASSFAKDYYGAEIRTVQSFLYGKFEVRMKSVEASGMLSSFFTFYDSPDFTSNWNEIDIEILGRYSNEIQVNAITPGNGERDPHEERVVLDFNPHDSLHVYAFEWAPDYIAWFVDGKEVARQDGEYIKKMNRPQKIMMNIWNTKWTEWTGEHDDSNFPVSAVYDYVKYYKYTSDGNFELDWEDNFNSFDGTRWQYATHSFDGNLCQFTPDNGKIKDGELSITLSKKPAVSSSGEPVPAPKKEITLKFEKAVYKKGKVRLTFSETLDWKSAKNISNYSIEGVKILKVKRVTDYSTEKQELILKVSGPLNASEKYEITVTNISDEENKEILTEETLPIKNVDL